jgi:hypothetical protein
MALSSKRNISRNQGVNQIDFEKVIIGGVTETLPLFIRC